MKSIFSLRNNLIIICALILVITFSWHYGSIYLSLGTCIIISVLFLVLNNSINFDKNTINILRLVISIGIAIIFFITVLSAKVLNTSTIDWLLSRADPAQHFLGWHFFRNEPWRVPPGIITDFNTPTGTSITYTDSIPLLAFFFKIFSRLLPNEFQYLGIWILLCYILQALFGMLFMRRLTSNISLQLLGLMFFIMSPVMLWRAYGHEALMGHWLILASLYLMKKDYKHIYWLLLLSVSLLVHPYLFLMSLLFFFIKICELLFNRLINITSCLIYLTTAGVVILLVLWFIGYFYFRSSGVSDGFGFYSMNINSVFNPQGWSQYVLKDQPNATGGQYEGFNYLGLGILLLMMWGFYSIVTGRSAIHFKGNTCLLVASIILSLIALSNIITFGDRVLFEIPIPELLLKICNVVRASGRFFWPVYYMIIILSLTIVIKSTKTKGAMVLLIVALSVQFTDLSGKFTEFHEMYASEAKWDNPLKSEIWEKIDGGKYRNIVFVPAVANKESVAFSMLASKKGMTINAVYTARDDYAKREQYNNELTNSFKNGVWDTKGIYIVDNSLLISTIENKKANDLFLSVDGFNLLIPNGVLDKNFKDFDLKPFDFHYTYGHKINFGSSGDSHVIKGYGWGESEEKNTWTFGKEASLYFVLDKPKKDLMLSIRMSPLTGGSLKEQHITLIANNHKIKELSITSTSDYQFLIPKDIVNNKLKIILNLPNAATPKELGINGDTRVLALSVESLSLD
ncbi:DUF6311 domain-containing protein [Paenibacillus sp. Lou8.1]|uniref:DUF6311 domain-containing protein n=1 Tax=Paenibacillus sp. Lou8.1 TaxID=2962041 RepID=UPI0020B83921|nr:DUF6311 domain-containing protein [Paenibacillus sp. Lou8.1]MCP3807850.1 DUF6311 domain-containing protein [Paenibacillus sp. Lou8.1]